MLTQFEIDGIIQGWPELPADIEHQLRDIALPRSRYLFYRRGKAINGLCDLMCGTKSTVYYGFCTYCQKQVQLAETPEHNSKMVCPNCGSVCITKKHGLGTKHLFDDGHFNIVQASGNKLFVRQLYVYLDYRLDKLHPKLEYTDNGYRWVLSADGCYKLVRKYKFYSPADGWHYTWNQQKSFTIDQHWAPYQEITPALLDSTYLQNSHAFDYLRLTHGDFNDLIQYADAYAKHPNIESLVNGKTTPFAKEYVKGSRAIMNRIINWKKLRPHEMLRIQKEELPLFLQLFESAHNSAPFYQKARLAGQHLTGEQVNTLKALWNFSFDERPAKESLKNGRIPKMLNYLKRQFRLSKRSEQGSHFDLNSLVTTWRDYLNECDQLGYDLTDDSIYYPPDLIKQHNRTMKLIKIKEDELSRQKAAARVKKLSWMTFEKGDLLIRPAESANALANEGKALHHCVATYADRYISGRTAIFFIRKSDQPDTSYFTLELNEKDFSVRQNRGCRNCDPPEEVTAFVEIWLKWLPIERKRFDNLKKKELKTA